MNVIHNINLLIEKVLEILIMMTQVSKWNDWIIKILMKILIKILQMNETQKKTDENQSFLLYPGLELIVQLSDISNS